MRLSLLSLLLLSAAAPAFADPVPDEPAEQVRAPRAERAERPERAEREYRRDAGAVRPRTVERAEPPRAASPGPVRDVAAAAVADGRRERPNRPALEARPDNRPVRGEAGRRWRENGAERRSRQRDLPPSAGSPVLGAAIPGPDRVVRAPRDVSPGSVAGNDLRGRIAAEGLRRDRIEREQWRREWRQDRRYDWRRHRDRDRSRFHLGIYIDPFGWGRRDWEIGWRLPSRYYASRYWIYDPWQYRLPPVSGAYRWIRYHDDVLLVDLRSGRVLDRIRNFFW